MTAPRVLATSDCERCRPGRWITQPANTVSSLAYVAAGAALAASIRRRSPVAGTGPDRGPGAGPGSAPTPERGADPARRRGATTTAVALAGLGVGSVAYHGPGGRAVRHLHDASIVAATLFLALGDRRAARGGPRPGPGHLAATSAVALVACGPRTTLAAQGLSGLAAAVADGMAWRASPPGSRSRRLRGLASGAWAVGAAAQATGRTGGPLCRPDSPFQVHALWHVVSATALTLTALAQFTDPDAVAPHPGGQL